MATKLSPLMQQYFSIKEQYPDCILFYRLGDFYEMFYDDAIVVSRELDLTLTGKNCGQEERAPMCGVPFHAADTYIQRMVEKGYKVAICEQVEDPAAAKGLVKREVIKIVTPGTITASSMLEAKDNNYLLCLFNEGEGFGLAYTDISTGELMVMEEIGKEEALSSILDEIVRIDPKEVLVNGVFEDRYDIKTIESLTDSFVQVLGNERFSEKASTEIIGAELGSNAIYSGGLMGRPYGIKALGGLLSYLLETQKQSLNQLESYTFYLPGERMSLDKISLRNLEITETLYEKKVKGSLLGILDQTKTAMGGRLIRRWLREPLKDVSAINQRLDSVEIISENPLLENNIKLSLSEIYDMERLAARIVMGTANGRDFLALKKSIYALPEIRDGLLGTDGELLNRLAMEISDLDHVAETIDAAISEDAPMTIKEGDLIKDGFSAELDELKASIKDAKDWIAGLEVRERERTGIKTLKVGYNKVFGYYIDVTRVNSDLVPEDYIRKQTLVNNERYITPELKDMESLVLNAEAKINKMEYEIFSEIRSGIEDYIGSIRKTSKALAEIDVLTSFAAVANRYGYIKPQVNDSLELKIVKGRHPVVEQTEKAGSFVSNDTYLNGDDSSLMIITGPNMSGKSTYMRQTALIVLMAQAGSFVPAEEAQIGVVDHIFTRIGASDNLSQGQSTFYVEMSELSYILGNAGPRSLIILDEIGRGTSTYDGLSIAWATAEFLCNKERRIRTLFATHYHELTVLEERVEGIRNLSVDVAEENGDIIFLHKIVEGPASKSYGIHVAKLAGVPRELLDEAVIRLSKLEDGSDPDFSYEDEEAKSGEGSFSMAKEEPIEGQLSFFVPGRGDDLIERLKNLNLMEITPSQAIGILEELKSQIED